MPCVHVRMQVTMQAWAVDQFPGGYEKADDLTNALDAIKWGADYLVNAHSAPNQFVAVVGNSTLDFNYYGVHEVLTVSRVDLWSVRLVSTSRI